MNIVILIIKNEKNLKCMDLSRQKKKEYKQKLNTKALKCFKLSQTDENGYFPHPIIKYVSVWQCNVWSFVRGKEGMADIAGHRTQRT